MAVGDDSTDPGKPVIGTDPDFRVRPAIEGDDPLAQGGWHSSGGTKATVVVPPLAAPGAAVEAADPVAPPGARRFRIASAEIEVATGVPPGRVVVLLLIACTVAFALGRWSGS